MSGLENDVNEIEFESNEVWFGVEAEDSRRRIFGSESEAADFCRSWLSSNEGVGFEEVGAWYRDSGGVVWYAFFYRGGDAVRICRG